MRPLRAKLPSPVAVQAAGLLYLAAKQKPMFQNIRIHLIALVVFIVAAGIFNAPVFSGKAIQQNDIKQYQGSAREVIDYREKEGRQILWSNVMFAGMPTYLVSAVYGGELLKHIPRTINGLTNPAFGYPLLLMIGFYILALALKVDPLIGIAGALAYGFSTYFMILLEAGHNSKIHAMAYLPGILAGMIWAYRHHKMWIGFAVFTLFTGLELTARHPQMFYYFLFLALAYGLWEFSQALKAKTLPAFLKTTAFLIVGAGIAVGSNLPYLSNTYNYGKKTIRGKSELTSNQADKTEGLDRSYVTNWSYGVDETWTLLIPNFKGGPTGQIGPDNEALKDVEPRFKQSIAGQNAYFGDQPFTSGPVYAGAVVILLAFLAFFLAKGSLRYLLLGVLLLTVALSWGRNFNGLTDFFLDYVPFYNKFRAVSSILVIPELILPLLAVIGLAAISSFDKAAWQEKVKLLLGGERPRQQAFYIGAGILLLFLGLNFASPSLFNTFLSSQEAETLPSALSNAGFSPQQADSFIEALTGARISIFKADVGRSLLFVLLGAGLIFFYQRGGLKKNYFIIGMAALILLDLFPVNKRYLNEENFVDADRLENNYGVQPSPADQVIMQQYANDPYFRTLNLTVGLVSDATTSFFHYSLGGYHGAKLKIYQELIEGRLGADIETLRQSLSNQSFRPDMLENLEALNMLNTRYIILNPNAQPLENTARLGNAWLVNNIQSAATADEEMAALNQIDTKTTAVLRSQYAEKAGAAGNGEGSISLKSYDPEKLVYSYNSNSANLALFSEIWYPENWTATIDNEPVEILRANYVLRALKVPAGQHEIVFEYQDSASGTANGIALICSLLILLGMPAILIWQNKK